MVAILVTVTKATPGEEAEAGGEDDLRAGHRAGLGTGSGPPARRPRSAPADPQTENPQTKIR